jgi:hypothetical protein
MGLSNAKGSFRWEKGGGSNKWSNPIGGRGKLDKRPLDENPKPRRGKVSFWKEINLAQNQEMKLTKKLVF